jgi:hypothetical protein
MICPRHKEEMKGFHLEQWCNKCEEEGPIIPGYVILCEEELKQLQITGRLERVYKNKAEAIFKAHGYGGGGKSWSVHKVFLEGYRSFPFKAKQRSMAAVIHYEGVGVTWKDNWPNKEETILAQIKEHIITLNPPEK